MRKLCVGLEGVFDAKRPLRSQASKDAAAGCRAPVIPKLRER